MIFKIAEKKIGLHRPFRYRQLGRPCENCVLRSCSKALVLGYVYSHIRNSGDKGVCQPEKRGQQNLLPCSPL